MPFPSLSCSKLQKPIQIAFFFVTFFCYLDLVHGLSTKPKVIDSHLLTEKISTNRSIIVDINGNGEFKSIQEAINSVPDGNSNWIIIHVRKGTYREKVHVTRNKPYIFMRGNGQGKTAIVSSQSSRNNFESATFIVEASNFVAFGIRFKGHFSLLSISIITTSYQYLLKIYTETSYYSTTHAFVKLNLDNFLNCINYLQNDAPTGIADTSQNQSVAAMVGADKVSFYRCGFLSTHNTLFDYKGRHYYDHCYIQGSIDFIFGRASSIFHDCEMFVVGDKRSYIHGSITAHYRDKATDNTGFVFQKGKVYGIGRHVYLGRARAAFSRVIFANTYLSNTIETRAWTNWSYAGDNKNLYMGEYKCSGPGSNSTSRVSWSKQLSDKEVAPYLSVDFINGKEWLPAWIENGNVGEGDKASTK